MSILPKLSDRDKAVLHSIFNPSLPLGDETFFAETKDEHETTVQNPEITSLEISAIKLAEEKKFDESLKGFEGLLKLNPNRAETYNNRAQVYRLMGKDKEAFDDLTASIELSEGIGKACQQALCQRGILYKKDGKLEEAKSDFERAAKLGSGYAKEQMIDMNPYAALCNQMLSKAFQQLK